MNYVRVYDPFGQIKRFDMDELFSAFLFPSPPPKEAANIRVPLCDFEDTTDSFIITMELPGVKKEDIKVTLNNNILSLTAQRKTEKEEKSKNFHHSERNYSSFQRTFELPSNVICDSIDAQFSDGLLNLTIKKANTNNVKEIQIR